MKKGCGLCRKYGRGCQYHPDLQAVGRRGDESGDESRKWCGAKKRNGKFCKLAPGWGTDHVGYGNCKFHLGATRNGRKAAQREMAEAEVKNFGVPLDVGAHEGLLMAVQGFAGWVKYLQQKVAELEENDLTWGKTREELRTGEAGGTVTIHESKPNTWYVLLQHAQRDLVAAASAAARAGVEERQVRVAESHAQIFAQAIKGILGELGVGDHPDAPRVVRKHLMLVSGKRAA